MDSKASSSLSTDPVIRDYQRYIKTIQTLQKAKKFADKKNQERALAWKDYYALEKQCKDLAADLGLDDDDTTFVRGDTDAPKKRKIEVVDLTEN